MTVISSIVAEPNRYYPNEIKQAILNNPPLEDKLHVIIVISNPCLYKRRYILAKEFIRRFIMEEPDALLYIVEVAYQNQKFMVTQAKNPMHLQVRTNSAPIWIKENMINMGVQHLLPKDWKAFAWIDADVEFDSPTWALDTLRILNGDKDIIQLFGHAVDMDANENAMQIYPSFGFQYTKNRPFFVRSSPQNYWHCGYAWAMTRHAYEKIGGIYDVNILGSGDYAMAMCLIGAGCDNYGSDHSQGFLNTISKLQNNMAGLRLGYCPGVIRHYFHGSKKNRKYEERWKILTRHKFDPFTHVTKRPDGLLVPTMACPPNLLQDINQYFLDRNEDEWIECMPNCKL